MKFFEVELESSNRDGPGAWWDASVVQALTYQNGDRNLYGVAEQKGVWCTTDLYGFD